MGGKRGASDLELSGTREKKERGETLLNMETVDIFSFSRMRPARKAEMPEKWQQNSHMGEFRERPPGTKPLLTQIRPYPLNNHIPNPGGASVIGKTPYAGVSQHAAAKGMLLDILMHWGNPQHTFLDKGQC